MSTTNQANCASNACSPVGRGVRAYFAPLDRTQPAATAFDTAMNGVFELEAPPVPWVDLGWVDKFTRKSESKVGVLAAGAPATTSIQIREQLDAVVTLRFLHWGKLQMALASGSEHWNLIRLSAQGGTSPAVMLLPGSTASMLRMGTADAATFSVGDTIAVDVDYAGETGYIGSGASAAYVRNAASIPADADYVRRVTLNAARISGVAMDYVELETPLIAGIPTPTMHGQPVVGFMDREGGTFFQEWSALFVIQGEEGGRILYNYPRLQAMATAQEATFPVTEDLEGICLAGEFRALPVVDVRDGQSALCYRTFLPADGMPL